ncbi:MAG: DUF4411 family protein [Candidatus Omnitrophica bacterium]|nr:DUF4411 family protein [Candidatus Omnitrophota bacterium]
MSSNEEEKIKYCIDSSALINIYRQHPADIYPKIWPNIEKLIQEERLISPLEVHDELVRYEDGLVDWVKDNKHMFIDVDDIQQDIMIDILKDHPGFASPDKEPPYADPWVIALAIRENREYTNGKSKFSCAVVTDESFKTNTYRIPNICSFYKIRYFNRFDFFRQEKWKFE